MQDKSSDVEEQEHTEPAVCSAASHSLVFFIIVALEQLKSVQAHCCDVNRRERLTLSYVFCMSLKYNLAQPFTETNKHDKKLPRLW